MYLQCASFNIFCNKKKPSIRLSKLGACKAIITVMLSTTNSHSLCSLVNKELSLIKGTLKCHLHNLCPVQVN